MDLTIPCFDPALIARSGQCFRMREGKGGIVTALAGAGPGVRMTPLGGGPLPLRLPAGGLRAALARLL